MVIFDCPHPMAEQPPEIPTKPQYFSWLKSITCTNVYGSQGAIGAPLGYNSLKSWWLAKEIRPTRSDIWMTTHSWSSHSPSRPPWYPPEEYLQWNQWLANRYAVRKGAWIVVSEVIRPRRWLKSIHIRLRSHPWPLVNEPPTNRHTDISAVTDFQFAHGDPQSNTCREAAETFNQIHTNSPVGLNEWFMREGDFKNGGQSLVISHPLVHTLRKAVGNTYRSNPCFTLGINWDHSWFAQLFFPYQPQQKAHTHDHQNHSWQEVRNHRSWELQSHHHSNTWSHSLQNFDVSPIHPFCWGLQSISKSCCSQSTESSWVSPQGYDRETTGDRAQPIHAIDCNWIHPRLILSSLSEHNNEKYF